MREHDRGTIGRQEQAMKMAGLFCAAAAALAWTGAVHGEVVATARSPEGRFPEFRVVLDALGAPVAVANFMGLVDGSQRWVDPETGWVRGGEGDAFYDGMVFDVNWENAVQGGLRGVSDGAGGVSYTGGPGYTVVGKTNETWTEFGWGALALGESGGPHSGGSELELFLTNGVTAWTVIGRVKAGDEAGAGSLKAAVEAAVATGGVTTLRWAVDASGATEAERAALEAARARLPVAEGLASRLTDAGFAWEWPGRSRLVISCCDDLMAGFRPLGSGWLESVEPMEMSVEWTSLGLTGVKGFGAATGVRYPSWSGTVPAGKWRMGMDHSGMRIQYWFDFDAKTGMLARVESGEIVEWGVLKSLSVRREFGNVWELFYSDGKKGTFYYLGVAGEEEREGRFMSQQIPGGTDWGLFEMAEGWGEEAKKSRRQNAQCTMEGGETGGFKGRWVDWEKRRADGERTTGVRFGRRTSDGQGGNRVRRGLRKRTGGLPRFEKEFGVGVFRIGSAGTEEGKALFDAGEKVGGVARRARAEESGDGGLDGNGFVEPSVESEGDGEGVLKDDVAGLEVEGPLGDGQDFGGGGR